MSGCGTFFTTDHLVSYIVCVDNDLRYLRESMLSEYSAPNILLNEDDFYASNYENLFLHHHNIFSKDT